jgi:hypothetical protein
MGYNGGDVIVNGQFPFHYGSLYPPKHGKVSTPKFSFASKR